QLRRKRFFLAAFQRGGEPDVVQLTSLIIQSKQERADGALAFVVSETANHAVGRTIVFDFLPAVAAAGFVGRIPTLGDDAIESRADLLKPFFRIRNAGGRRRKSNRFPAAKILACESFEHLTPCAERSLREDLLIGIQQQVENDKQRRRFSCETLHTARRRVNTLQEVVEGEGPTIWHDNFAIENEVSGLKRGNGSRELRE